MNVPTTTRPFMLLTKFSLWIMILLVIQQKHLIPSTERGILSTSRTSTAAVASQWGQINSWCATSLTTNFKQTNSKTFNCTTQAVIPEARSNARFIEIINHNKWQTDTTQSQTILNTTRNETWHKQKARDEELKKNTTCRIRVKCAGN